MNYWLSRVLTEINVQKKSQEKIAKDLLGISGPAFSKNLSGKSELGFLNAVKLAYELYGNDFEMATYTVHEYCKLIESPKNIKLAMEYANSTGDLELLRIAIQKGFISDNDSVYEWACVYELLWIRSKDIMNSDEFYEEVETRKKEIVVKSTEMKILLDIITFYALYDLTDFEALYKHADKLTGKIGKIKNSFFNNLYKNKVKEGMAYALLMDDQVEKSREICHSILNAEDICGSMTLLKVSALGYLAESYSLDSANYDQALWYLNKGIELLEKFPSEKTRKRKVKFLNMQAFLKMIHKKDIKNLQISDVGEQALFHIVEGELQEAIDILQSYEKEHKKLSPMKKTYLGMALQDKELISEAIEDFIAQGCKFYSKLSRKILTELVQNGTIYMGDAK